MKQFSQQFLLNDRKENTYCCSLFQSVAIGSIWGTAGKGPLLFLQLKKKRIELLSDKEKKG